MYYGYYEDSRTDEAEWEVTLTVEFNAEHGKDAASVLMKLKKDGFINEMEPVDFDPGEDETETDYHCYLIKVFVCGWDEEPAKFHAEQIIEPFLRREGFTRIHFVPESIELLNA